MNADPRKLRPGELCQLLNSTPLGEVIDDPRLRRQRTRAGLRIGDGRRIDLLRYVAWLIEQRAPSTSSNDHAHEELLQTIHEAVLGVTSSLRDTKDTTAAEVRLTSKQETAVAALLTEPTYRAAASRAGVSERTLYRWLRDEAFVNALRITRRKMVELAVGRMQAATGQAVTALLDIAHRGQRDSDRLRAATALLDRAFQGLSEAVLLHGTPPLAETTNMQPHDVVQVLSAHLRQIEASELSATEKSRQAVQLADTLLRAIQGDVLEQRLQSLEAVLFNRKPGNGR